MKLIELLFYMEDYIPLRIATEDNGLEIICFTEELETLLKKEEKRLKKVNKNFENLSYIILEQKIKSIDLDGENERIEIILEI